MKEELARMSGLGREYFDNRSVSSSPLMFVCVIDAGEDVQRRRCDGLQSEWLNLDVLPTKDVNARFEARGEADAIDFIHAKFRRAANRRSLMVDQG